MSTREWTDLAAQRAGAARVASMKPQHFCRGRSEAIAQAVRLHGQLQWGTGISAGEEAMVWIDLSSRCLQELQ
jgi:hypothetical protein